MLWPKSKGSGIIVSDFVDERNGFLTLTEEEFEEANKTDVTIQKQARQTLEIGVSSEGYWSSAVKIAETQYPKNDNWSIVWVFDQSSCHTAMADDALNADQMNVKPGGQQPKMRDTVWEGNVH